MPRIVRNRTIADLEDAYLTLRDLLADVAPDALDSSPAQGCCGCGSPMADVCTLPTPGYPHGEGYCWRCADHMRIGADEYTILTGRDR